VLGPFEGGAPGLPPRTVLALELEAARTAGDTALALERTRRAARASPMDAELQEWWAAAAADAGDAAEEVLAWTAALAADPRADSAAEAHRRSRLAQALARAGRGEEALPQLLLAAERAPEEPPLLEAAARALGEAGRMREAIGYGERAALLEPDLALRALSHSHRARARSGRASAWLASPARRRARAARSGSRSAARSP
jgi:tetratricopeptide (TPR) repeat protein